MGGKFGWKHQNETESCKAVYWTLHSVGNGLRGRKRLRITGVTRDKELFSERNVDYTDVSTASFDLQARMS